MADPRRAVIYARISQSDGRDVTIDDQIRTGQQYARQQDWFIVDTIADVDVSAATFERPGWNKILKLARSRRIDVIIAKHPDRVSRDIDGKVTPSYFQMRDQILADLGVTLEFTSYTAFDTGTAAGWMGDRIGMLFAQFHIEQSREKAHLMRRQRLERGAWPGGILPLGTRLNESSELERDPEDWHVIEFVFRRWLDTNSIAQVVRDCAERGYRSRPRKKPGKTAMSRNRLDKTAVRRILTNRHYLGEMQAYGRTWRCAGGSLIDTDIFERANALLNGRRRSRSPEKRVYLLSGLVFEAATGLPMTGYFVDSKKRKRTYYYKPLKRLLSPEQQKLLPGLQMKLVPAEKLEAEVLKAFCDLADDPKIARFEAEAITEMEKALRILESELERENEYMQKCLQTYRMVLELKSAGHIPPEPETYELEQDILQRKNNLAELNEAISLIQAALGQHDLLTRTIKQISQLAGHIGDSERHYLRSLLSLVTGRIAVSPEGFELVLMGIQPENALTNVVSILGEGGIRTHVTR
ncbi:recombinase family protein [bacterium]|nr:recombinase family protein [bacterium]